MPRVLLARHHVPAMKRSPRHALAIARLCAHLIRLCTGGSKTILKAFGMPLHARQTPPRDKIGHSTATTSTSLSPPTSESCALPRAGAPSRRWVEATDAPPNRPRFAQPKPASRRPVPVLKRHARRCKNKTRGHPDESWVPPRGPPSCRAPRAHSARLQHDWQHATSPWRADWFEAELAPHAPRRLSVLMSPSVESIAVRYRRLLVRIDHAQSILLRESRVGGGRMIK